MLGKLAGWDDTIAALATPQGVGAIGVIRVSGPKAIAIVNGLFPSKDLEAAPTHTLHVGYLKYNDTIIDEVVIGLYKAPRSYTGEDVVEISCHGSYFIQNNILQILAQCGARAAKPGEFTQRAFLNGKLNLAQAEAVADLIASNTAASRKAALHTMRGGFTEVLKNIREELLTFSALIELELDFSEEDVEFADRSRLMNLLDEAAYKVKQLLQSFMLGNVIKNGVQVAIIGKPNAGKSTLLNALLNEERAIVSEIAGTTRDTIEETLNINGILFRLIDTAGIREHTSDVIESVGVQRSLQKMRSADIVLYVFDATAISKAELQQTLATMQTEGSKIIAVANKTDEEGVDYATKFTGIAGIVFISARYQRNMDVLQDALYTSVVNDEVGTPETIVTNTRHVAALEKVLQSIVLIKDGFAQRTPLDLITSDIRACLYHIGEITGEITNEDQLDFIFSKFCIGK
ncbi:tRNA uridine-5-carboxymethylaminomethyl(34) synthesis GTPase MnmE [Ilyomonas limi]|uniref:tRNA modification GTPase MnmE n=1 Tax=Ilyomonas limi TaxID=2575867 RepID=A0A4U3KYR6_9BACT|nr:tRNA uridine-5-carboxymethylaminomethyl(34) synthesis GTPase MnmE [Ilyomonas limi]TKK67650.1 tRNA uridine-5-carboxymethylaminomethyl(34) synthesis GTPase MnmE [Ilyomonas limi]